MTPEDLERKLEEFSRRLEVVERRLNLRAPDPGPKMEWREMPPQAPQAPAAPPPVSPYATVVTPPAPAASTTVNRQELETRIGAGLLNRIGVVAVLFGMAYFLKLAFDNNWVGPAGRVAIGLIVGIGLLLWSERFRSRGYVVFSYSIKAAGAGVLYLSIWAAQSLYQLVGAETAFLSMVVVTIAITTIAIRQEGEPLAFIGLLGGYLTPILVSSDRNAQLVLFTYVLILDVAAVLIARHRGWHRLIVMSFGWTTILYALWAEKHYTLDQYGSTITFASLFFLLFLVAPLVRSRDRARPSAPVTHVLLPFFNSTVFLIECGSALRGWDLPALGFFALVIAAAHFVVSQLLAREKNGAAGQIAASFLIVGLMFATIAVPLEFDDHAVTLGWLVECILLLVVWSRWKHDTVGTFALIVLVLAMMKLLFVDSLENESPFLNPRFANYLVAIGILGTLSFREATKDREAFSTRLAILALNGLVFFGMNAEIDDLLRSSSLGRESSMLRGFIYSATWMTLGGILMAAGFIRRFAYLRWLALGLIGVTIAKVFLWDLAALDQVWRVLSFIALGALLLAVSFAYQRLAKIDEATSGGPSRLNDPE